MGAATKVDAKRLRDCISKVEANGSLASHSVLYDTVSEVYNTGLIGGFKKISANVVKARIIEDKIPIKTISGRQKSANVDRKALQECIIQVEELGVKRNWAELFSAVAEIYNSVTEQNCSGAVLQKIATDDKMDIETPRGKKGAGLGMRIKRRKRMDVFAGKPEVQKSFKEMRKELPLWTNGRFLPVIEKIESGSLTAAVKLKCLECSGFISADVRTCGSTGCSLWPFRPYQTKDDKPEIDIVEEDSDQPEEKVA